jgi:predicted nuclease of restriction endonuclease-like (RecB) superfamily
METWGSCITKINSEEILTTFVFIKGSEYIENLNSYKTFINSDKEYYTKDELRTIVDEIENDLN